MEDKIVGESEMEEGLLRISSSRNSNYVEEVKKIGYIAAPMVAVVLSQYMVQMISTMMVGHISELALASSSIAISLSSVTGFSLIVSLLIIMDTYL